MNTDQPTTPLPQQGSSKTVLFLARSAPYGTSRARALTDMVLAAAVFDQNIHYVFLDDGVGQLLADQQPAGIDAKNTSAELTALELYGVEQVYVHESSLRERGLDAYPLLVDVERCDTAHIQTLLAQADHVFTL